MTETKRLPGHKMFPLVSVMIPTYNMPEVFQQALESARKQDYPNLEILVCDNSTNEDTARLMKCYEKDKRIRYFRNRDAKTKEENFAPFESLARGEYLQWLMHDDILLPGKISRMASILRHRPDITLVTSQRGVIDLEGRRIKSPFEVDLPLNGADYGVFSGEEMGHMMLANVMNAIGEPSAVLFRRRDLKNHYWHADCRGYKTISDVAMWLELMEKGNCIVFRKPLSYYRRHAAQEGQQPDVILLSRIEWYSLMKEYYQRDIFVHTREDVVKMYQMIIDESKKMALSFEPLASPAMRSRYRACIMKMEQFCCGEGKQESQPVSLSSDPRSNRGSIAAPDKEKKPLRILITIPHFYKYNPASLYGSGTQDRKTRSLVLRNMICSLRNRFNPSHAYSYQAYDRENDIDEPPHIVYEPADTESVYDVDICLCTTAEDHLVRDLDLPSDYFRWAIFSVSNPLFLGYTCHQVLKENRGKYDYYCYMEDDLVIPDEDFFRKLRWFEKQFGSECLLQPNRYMEGGQPFYKEYMDPEMGRHLDRWYEDDSSVPQYLETEYLGEKLLFHKTRNPHSGCFFLSARQYELMCQRENYAEPEYRFCGPLECSASLDILRTFSIYRADYRQGNFFEIKHLGKKGVETADIRINKKAFVELGNSML